MDNCEVSRILTTSFVLTSFPHSSNQLSQVCSSCVASSAYGDTISGNFELEFELNSLTSGGQFVHSGGGLVVRFEAQGDLASDNTCTAVLMWWYATDASGYFVQR